MSCCAITSAGACGTGACGAGACGAVGRCCPPSCKMVFQLTLTDQMCTAVTGPVSVFRVPVTQPCGCVDPCSPIPSSKVVGYAHGVLTSLTCESVVSTETKLVMQIGQSMLVLQLSSWDGPCGPVHAGVVLASTCTLRTICPNTPVCWTVQTVDAGQLWTLTIAIS